MPTNGIKYTTGPNETGCLKRGNMLIANNTADYGGSFYSGISPGASGYTIYINKPTGGPSIICPASDSEMIGVTNGLAGTTFVTGPSALNWYNTQPDKLCVNRDYEQIVIDGLVIASDAGFTPSYPKGGTGFFDLSGLENIGTLTNGPTYAATAGGALSMDGTDDFVNYPYNVGLDLPTARTTSVWLKLNQIKFSTMIGQSRTGGFNQRKWDVRYGANSGTDQFIRVVLGQGGPQMNCDSRSTFNLTNGWYNLAVAYDGAATSCVIYVNGAEAGSISNAFASLYSSVAAGTNEPGFNLGRRNDGGNVTNGIFSNFLVYNRPLAPTEVLQNYQAMLPRFVGENIVSSGLVLYLDAGYSTSYPGTGTSWFNVAGTPGATGTLFNSPTYSPSNGGILTFDGTDDYATVPFTTNYPDFTINFFFRLTGAKTYSYAFSTGNGNASESFQIEFNDPDAGNTARTLWCWWKSTSGFDGGLYVGSTGTPGSWNDNTWRMLTFTHTGSTNILYINGVLATFSTAGDQTIPFFGGTNCVISIGRRQASGSLYYQGNLPIVSVYNRVLSPSEVLQNFNAQKSRFGL